MTDSPDRLDRIEPMLENTVEAQNREREAESRLREDLEILYQSIRAKGKNLENLRATGEQDWAEFRSQMLDLQTEAHRILAEQRQDTARIWQYLIDHLANRGNGHPT